VFLDGLEVFNEKPISLSHLYGVLRVFDVDSEDLPGLERILGLVNQPMLIANALNRLFMLIGKTLL